ncbi:hypothetical protein OKW22_000027 [Bacilli bacterium PM5-3]|nr:hypothetical protein [Bacilli bacterium PM5-3]
MFLAIVGCSSNDEMIKRDKETDREIEIANHFGSNLEIVEINKQKVIDFGGKNIIVNIDHYYKGKKQNDSIKNELFDLKNYEKNIEVIISSEKSVKTKKEYRITIGDQFAYATSDGVINKISKKDNSETWSSYNDFNEIKLNKPILLNVIGLGAGEIDNPNETLESLIKNNDEFVVMYVTISDK